MHVSEHLAKGQKPLLLLHGMLIIVPTRQHSDTLSITPYLYIHIFNYLATMFQLIHGKLEQHRQRAIHDAKI